MMLNKDEIGWACSMHEINKCDNFSLKAWKEEMTCWT